MVSHTELKSLRVKCSPVSHDITYDITYIQLLLTLL